MVILSKRGIYVSFETKDRTERSVVKKSLSFLHPDAYMIPSFRDGKWDGIIKYYNTKDEFGVGLLKYVIKSLNKNDIDYILIGFEENSVDNVEFSQPFLSDDRDYQRESVLSFLRNGYGIIKVPTRGGKTFIAAEIIRLLLKDHPNYNVLFFTDTLDALKQNSSDLAKILNRNVSEIGVIQGQRFDPKQISIAMIQTVQLSIKSKAKNKDKRLKFLKYLDSIDLLIVDEIQEYGSKERMKTLRKCVNLQYFLSISATPLRVSDKITSLNIESLTGGILYEIHEKELVEKEVLAKNKILLILNDIERKRGHDSSSYSELTKELIYYDEHRNSIISTIIEVCERLGLKTLVLFTSIEHGYYVSKETDTLFVCGDHSLEDREMTKQWFLEGKGKILFASNIWKKAITLPEVEVLINADGGKEETLIIQKRGRVLGVTKDKKKALTIDIMDNYEKYYNEHSLNRISVYENQVGSENIDVLDSRDVNFVSFVESYLIGWFDIAL